MKQIVTVRLDPAVVDRLNSLAKATQRSKSYLVAEAVASYLDVNAWQVEAIQEGIRQADSGRLIPHEQVRRKWEARRGRNSRKG